MATKSTHVARKVVLITGAAQGIGRAIAKVFAEKGSSVVITDIQESAGQAAAMALRDAGLRALFVKADLRLERDIKTMIDFAVQSFGRLDTVINNVRPKLRHLPFAESLEEWDLAMDVLLKAPALTAKHALPQLIKCGGGSIVNIASTNAFFVSDQSVAYHVAKAGLLHLTRCLAVEFGPQGIRVNAICPGLVDLYDVNKTPLTNDPVNKAVTELIVPLERASCAEEIARVVMFLCTEAAAYITGQVLTVDGGVTLGDHFRIAKKALRHTAQRSKGSSP